MKKLISLGVAIILLFALTACSKTSDQIPCPDCGKSAPADSSYCNYCGAALKHEEGPTGPTFPEEELQYPAENAEWKYDVFTTYVALTQYKGSAAEVVIPETIEGLPVIEIKANENRKKGCFSNNKTIKKVVLTKNIKRIGGFEYSSIENIVFASDAYIEFDTHTFQGCGKIKNVSEIIAHMPGGRFPQIFMESNSFALKNIVIPDRFTSIDNYAFYGCSALETIDVGNVSKIGDNVFDRTSLKKLTVHNKACDMGDYYRTYQDLTFTIAAPAGSTAAQFASANNISFTVIKK